MTDYGVTANGFVLKDYATILDELKADIREHVGDDVDLSDNSLLGQILKSFAYAVAAQWQVLEAAYTTAYLDTATADNLDAAIALVGLTRLPATKAAGAITYSRTTAAVVAITIPAGSRVSNADGTIVFVTTADATLAIGQTAVSVAVAAQIAGADYNVSAGVICHILDPISGIESVINAADMAGGTDAETDAALRLRVRTYAPGAKATLLAIKNAIMAVTGVITCTVTEDTSAHTITALVLGGQDAAINAAIAVTRPAGITASLTRPTQKTVTVTATTTKVSGGNATTIRANILAKITAYFATLTIDSDIMYSAVANAIIASDGVASLDSLSITMGSTTINAFGQAITIGSTEVAVEGSHNITVS